MHETFGGTGAVALQPELREVDDLDGGPGYPILTSDYTAMQGAWWRTPVVPGTLVARPTPVFAQLDAGVVETEPARLREEAGGGGGQAAASAAGSRRASGQAAGQASGQEVTT